MARFFKKRESNKGLPPGSLVFIGSKKVESVRIRSFEYDSGGFKESTLDSAAELKGLVPARDSAVTWVNIDGLHDTELIREAGRMFDLHPLILDDIVNTGQRPKFEEYDNCLFLVLKMLRWGREEVISEQLSVVIGENYVLTFQEQYGDVFEPIRERIRKQKGRIRDSGHDYLAYALMDMIIDNYIDIVERIGESIEDMEDDIISEPNSGIIEKLYVYKRELHFLRRAVRPAREALLKLNKSEGALIADSTMPFLKDLLGHATEVAEVIDTYRDMTADYVNMYNANISNKMNEVMKVLTIFAAIFIPLTFIAGIYGTNFEYLPELGYRYGYFIFLGVLIVIALGMVLFFKKKKWI